MSSSTEKVLLKSSDGQFFEVDKEVAQLSQTLKHLVEDTEPNTAIPLANVTSAVLAKVIEYCKKHSEASAGAKDALNAWDREFVKVEQTLLFDILMASNFLNIPELLDLICQTVADMIKGKSPEEIRSIFNIKNDFTEEEEQAIRQENQWAFE